MKIAAVVVTFNRLELLKRSIDALRAQTRPLDEIIVVNNGSSDGTLDWLQSQEDIFVVTQENTGSAGGQHTGFKTAYDRGNDWIWCMDDDGFASPNCLEELSKHIHLGDFVNALVLQEDDDSQLSFGLVDAKGKTYVSVAELHQYNPDGFFQDYANPFNGTLLSRKLLEGIGYPRKEFFIWGDEIEFLMRAKRSPFKVVTNLNAIFYHPKPRFKYKSILKGRIRIMMAKPLGLYCFYRNTFHIYKSHFSTLKAYTFLSVEFIKRIILVDFGNLKILYLASQDAIFNVWGREKKFLK